MNYANDVVSRCKPANRPPGKTRTLRSPFFALRTLLAASVFTIAIGSGADATIKINHGTKAKTNAHITPGRAGYAKWLRHGDVYKVDGSFGSFKRSFNVRISWKGNGYVISTPLGAYRLKRRGSSVTFKVYIQKSWAYVTWKRSKAYVRYKNHTGSAKVVKVGNGAARNAQSKRSQNFNQ